MGFRAPTTGPVTWQRSCAYDGPLLFVIPSEAEGSAVLRTFPGNVFQLLRRATIGLIRDARRAGIYPATSATNSSNRIMLKKVA
jgi:hypothetical protein